EDILLVPCHAYNDYWHRVPLYEGLAAGCASTEADIWLGKLPNGEDELFVGHTSKSLTYSRTLRSLYLNPLDDILTHQQVNSPVNLNTSSNALQPLLDTTSPVGVFSMSPNTTLVLLLDFKTSGDNTWSTVLTQLDDMRSHNWLTTWTPTKGVVQRPLTIVATGEAPFDSIIANETYRDIFYDAPLTSLPLDTGYNVNNSYYASTSLSNAIGKTRSSKLSANQKGKITRQVQRAGELGLKSRYWDTPAWPVGWRNRVWESLIELGADVLNVDDLTAAARWDWQMCVVGGINICNS
ncbi:Altered inheritance of mitochondria protein 6-like, partial [Lachnellula arida]